MKKSFITLVLIFNQAYANELSFGKLQGSITQDIAACVLQEAYKHLNYKVNFVELKGQSSFVRANEGKYDGETSRIRDIENRVENLIRITTPIYEIKGTFYSSSSKIKKSFDLKFIEKYKIAIYEGSVFSVEYTKIHPNILVLSSYEAVMNVIANGRADIGILPYATASELKQKMKLKHIMSLGEPFRKYPLYHYLHKKNAKLVPKIESILSKMYQKGRIKEIYKEFLRLNVKEKYISKNYCP